MSVIHEWTLDDLAKVEADIVAEAGSPDCKGSPEGPPSTPTVKSASVTELRRNVTSIIGRRKKLEKAVKKLGQVEKKLAKKDTTSNQVNVGCAKIAIKIAKDWLEFTLARYTMLKAMIEDNGSDKSVAAANKVASFGDKIASDANVHLLHHDDEGAPTTNPLVPAMPEIPKVAWDKKTNELMLQSGQVYGTIPVPDDLGLPSDPPPTTPEPAPEPEPEEPKTYASLSKVDQISLNTKLKAQIIKAYSDHGGTVNFDNHEVFAEFGVGWSAVAWDKALGELQVDYDDAKMMAQIAEIGDKAVKTFPSTNTMSLAVAMTKATAKELGVVLGADEAFTVVKEAQGKQYEGKNLNSYSGDDQNKILTKIKEIVIGEAGSGPVTNSEIKLQLGFMGLPLSDEQINAKAISMSDSFVVPSGVGISYLDPSVIQITVGIAKKLGSDIYLGDLIDAVSDGGIAHLSQTAANEIQAIAFPAEEDTKPDEAGFLKEVETLYSAAKHQALFMSVSGFIEQAHKSKYVGLLSHYHLESTQHLKDKMDKIRMESMKIRWDAGKAKTRIIDKWEQLVEKVEPNQFPFITAGKAALQDWSADVGYFGAGYHNKVHGSGLVKFIQPIWDVWFGSWESAQKDKKPEPAKPKAGAAPPPPPKSHAYVPNAAELDVSYDTKLSTFWEMTVSQKKWMVGQIKDGIVSGAIPVTSNGLLDKSSKSYKAWRKGVRKTMKTMWSVAGVTSVGWKMFDTKANGFIINDGWMKKDAAGEPTKTGLTKTLADWHAVKGDHWLAVAPGTQANIHDIVSKVEKQGFGSVKQVKAIKGATIAIVNYLATQSAGEAPPTPQTPSVMPEITTSTPPSMNVLNMTPDEITMFLSDHGPPVDAPSMPDLSAKGVWKDKKATFGSEAAGGLHSKVAALCDADGTPSKTGDHLWLVKTAGEPGKRHIAYAEGWATRLQQLIGLGTTKQVWIKPDGVGGELSVVQLFKKQKDISNSTNGNGYASTNPWITKPSSPNANSVAKTMMRYHIFHYLVDSRDDHAGNFVQDPDTKKLTSVDHGQSFKFFDASSTLYHALHRHTQSAGDSGRLPANMMLAWQNGDDVAMDGVLIDPEFTNMLDQLESIPSDAYKNGLTKYAEGNDKSYGGTGKNKLKTAAFLTAVNERRLTIRKQIGAFYKTMVVARAERLKEKGDTRELDVIEQEIIDQIGLDTFLEGSQAKVEKVPDAKPLTAADFDEAPGWDESKLPKSSHLPTDKELALAGSVGTDVVMSSTDVKNGQATFYKLDDNPMMWCRLDRAARKRLQARLPGAGGPQPPQPVGTFAFSDFSFDPFVPPPKPMFDVDGDDLHVMFNHVAGMSNFVKPDGETASRIEKYIDKWAKGITKGTSNGSNYIRQAWDWAKSKSISADPVEAAAGKHYVDAMSKIGEPMTGGDWTFKDVDDVPEVDRRPTAFVLTPELQAARDAAKAETEKTWETAKAVALSAWESDKDKDNALHIEAKEKAKKEHGLAEAHYQSLLKAFNKETENSNIIPAKKLSDWQVPDKVTLNSVAVSDGEDQGGSVIGGGEGKALDYGSSWNGLYVNQSKKKKSTPSPRTCFEIDLTDVVVQLGLVAKGGGSAKKRLLIHYQPSVVGNRQPGRDGAMRIQFPSGSTKDQIRKMTQLVNAKLGLDIRPASGQEQELNYLRQMAWHRHLEGRSVGGHFQIQEDKELGADATVQQRIDFWAARFEKAPSKSPITKGNRPKGRGVGYDPRFKPKRTATGKITTKAGKVVYEKDEQGNRKPNPRYQPIAVDIGAGQKQFRRFDVTDEEILGMGAKALSAHVHAGLESLVLGMQMSCSNWRFNLGMNAIGDSPGSDARTGGSAVTYMRTGSAPHSNAIHIDPRAFGFTGVWSHDHDAWGATQDDVGGHSHKTRAATVKEHQLGESLSTNLGAGETLLWPRLSLVRWAKKINLTSLGKVKAKKLRDEIKAALAKQGITTMGPDNKPIDEVIYIG